MTTTTTGARRGRQARPKPQPGPANGQGATVHELPSAQTAQPGGRRAIPGEPWHYSLDPDRRGIWKGGADDAQPVLDWCPEVVAHLVRLGDDDRVVERRFRIRINPDDEPVTVTNDDLTTGRVWHDLLPEAAGTGSKRTREILHSLVQEQARQLPKTYMPQRSGWATLPSGGGWRYVAGVETDPASGAELIRPAYDRPGALAGYGRPEGSTLEAGAGALDQMCGHGWGGPLGASAGIRALADSLRPVRTALIPIGPPATGKSSVGWAVLAVAMHPAAPGESWPPVADASFSAAAGGMERRIAEAGDRGILLDDLPLTSESGGRANQEAAEKVDRVCRSYFNASPLRDRADRTGTRLQPSVMVRGLPVITAQRVPNQTQASLIRRVVLAEMAPGDNDTPWYKDHGAELLPGLRALGLAVIDALAALGPAGAKAAVDAADQAGTYEVYRAYRRAGGADVLEMAGPLDGAGRMVGGLVLLENLTGITTGHLLSEILDPLAASLARQAQLMADRQAADTDLGEAVGAVIRQALVSRRAHVRNAATDVPGDQVPGQTMQTQGLRENPGSAGGLLADGVEVYWLPDRGCVGISSKALHTLAATGRDARLQGLGPTALARHLLAEGVTLPGHQATDATTRVRVGARTGGTLPRLVLVPAGLVFDLGDDQPEGQAAVEPPTQPRLPDPPPPPEPAAPAGPDQLPEVAQDEPLRPPGPATDAEGPQDGPPLPDEPPHPEGHARPPGGPEPGPWQPGRPWVAVTVGSEDVPEYGAEGPQHIAVPPGAVTPEPPERPQEPPEAPRPPNDPPQRQGPARRATAASHHRPWSVLAVASSRIGALNASGWVWRDGPTGGLGKLLAELARQAPPGDVTAVVDEAAAEAYGIDPDPPAVDDARTPAFLEAVSAAGWCRPGADGGPPRAGVGGWTVARPGGGVLRVMPTEWQIEMKAAWHGPDDPAGEQAPPAELVADRLARFYDRTGWPPQGTPAATALRSMRDEIEGTRRGRTPIWQGGRYEQAAAGRSPRPYASVGWSRDLTPEELAGGSVHCYDAVRNHLAAYRRAALSMDELRPDPDSPLFDPARAGFWRIIVPELPEVLRDLPPPLPGTRAGQNVWTTTDRLMLYYELGEQQLGDPMAFMPQILESWTGPRHEHAGIRRWATKINDQLDALNGAADPLDVAVYRAVKAMYQAAHSKLRSDQQAVIYRPDWGWAFHDAPFASVVRRAWQAAGALPLNRSEGGLWVPDPARIVAISTDEIAIAGPADMAAPAGIPIEHRLGGYQPSGTHTAHAWQEAHRAPTT